MDKRKFVQSGAKYLERKRFGGYRLNTKILAKIDFIGNVWLLRLWRKRKMCQWFLIWTVCMPMRIIKGFVNSA